VIIWILLAAIAVMTGGFIASRVARRADRQLPPGTKGTALLERTLKDVRPDDVVQHRARDWLVEGVVSYDEDGHTWRSARMVDSGEQSWLLIGLDRGPVMTVRYLEDAPSLSISGYPSETIEHNGVTYKLEKRGTANASFQGDLTGIPGATSGGTMRARWWKYQAAGEKVMVIEQWGDAYRPMTGRNIPPEDVDLLAAS
jgi:Domain of unknown function (DUF4178)